MKIMALRVELLLETSTVRERRRRIQSVLDKLHEHLNVAVLDLEQSDHPQKVAIGVVTLAGTRREAREILERVADALAAHPRLTIVTQTFHEV